LFVPQPPGVTMEPVSGVSPAVKLAVCVVELLV